MNAAICARDLCRAFGGRQVLRDVSFAVDEGETLVLAGANGSGKTTLLEILVTSLFPTSGSASVYGLDVVRSSAAVRSLVGYCSSNLRSLYPRMTGRRNLQFFAALYQVDAAVAASRIAQLLEELGLQASADVRVERYSDGTRARLCLARALLTDPPVLLLDEPTKSLDPAARVAVRSLIFRPTSVGRPRTVLWVTHDLDEAAAVSRRIAVLAAGRLLDAAAVAI